MKHRILLIATFLLGSNIAFTQHQVFNPQTLESHVRFLASDSLKGRYPGTPEDVVTAHFIRDHFAENGLELLFDEGMQTFEVVTSIEPSVNNSLIVGGIDGVFGRDYGLYSFSSSATIEAEVVFAGFGMVIQTDELQRNDYEGVDAEGKWVLVLKGDPEPDNNNSAYIPFASARSKALFARDQGAAGIGFLLLMAGGYAAKKMYDARKKLAD